MLGVGPLNSYIFRLVSAPVLNFWLFVYVAEERFVKVYEDTVPSSLFA